MLKVFFILAAAIASTLNALIIVTPLKGSYYPIGATFNVTVLADVSDTVTFADVIFKGASGTQNITAIPLGIPVPVTLDPSVNGLVLIVAIPDIVVPGEVGTIGVSNIFVGINPPAPIPRPLPIPYYPCYNPCYNPCRRVCCSPRPRCRIRDAEIYDYDVQEFESYDY